MRPEWLVESEWSGRGRGRSSGDQAQDLIPSHFHALILSQSPALILSLSKDGPRAPYLPTAENPVQANAC